MKCVLRRRERAVSFDSVGKAEQSWADMTRLNSTFNKRGNIGEENKFSFGPCQVWELQAAVTSVFCKVTLIHSKITVVLTFKCGWNPCVWPFWSSFEQYHSNESYWAVLSCSTVYYAAQSGSNSYVFAPDKTLVCDYSNKSYWTVLSCATICFSLFCKLKFGIFYFELDELQYQFAVRQTGDEVKVKTGRKITPNAA